MSRVCWKSDFALKLWYFLDAAALFIIKFSGIIPRRASSRLITVLSPSRGDQFFRRGSDEINRHHPFILQSKSTQAEITSYLSANALFKVLEDSKFLLYVSSKGCVVSCVSDVTNKPL